MENVVSRPRSKSERRRRVLIASAAVMVIAIGGFVTATANVEVGHPRNVDLVRIFGFAALTFVIALRATSGFTLLNPDPAMNDELTRANRASAARAGFWAMLIGAWMALGAALFVPITLLEIAPLLIAMGAAGAALRFSLLEARGDDGD